MGSFVCIFFFLGFTVEARRENLEEYLKRDDFSFGN